MSTDSKSTRRPWLWSSVKLFKFDGERNHLIREKEVLARELELFEKEGRFSERVSPWGLKIVFPGEESQDFGDHTPIHAYSLRVYYRDSDGTISPIYDFREVKRFVEFYRANRAFPPGVTPWSSPLDNTGRDDALKGGTMARALKKARF